jgi:hypothetical protein
VIAFPSASAHPEAIIGQLSRVRWVKWQVLPVDLSFTKQSASSVHFQKRTGERSLSWRSKVNYQSRLSRMSCSVCFSSYYRLSRFRVKDLTRLTMLQLPVRCRNCHRRSYITIFVALSGLLRRNHEHEAAR